MVPGALRIPRADISAALLLLTTVILTLRLPGSVVLCLALPVLSLVVTGLHRPRRNTWLWWLFLGSGTIASLIAVTLNPGGMSVINYATLTITFVVFTAAILCGGRQSTAVRGVMTGLYYATALVLLIGWVEVITGFKLMRVFYPDAHSLVLTGRWYVAAFYPNYNDFAVMVTLFALMALARFCWPQAAGTLRQALRLVAYAAAGVIIVAGGSRGALAALAVGSALIAITAIRTVRSRLITATFVVVVAAFVGAAGLLIWSTPEIQDNSTKVRGSIIDRTINLSLLHDNTAWFGWGNLAPFKEAAQSFYPDQLMDPHNLLLELFSWYGAPTLVVFLVVWLYVVVRGPLRLWMPHTWTHVSAIILFALLPVLGIVPSSTMRYYLVFVLGACAVASLHSRRKECVAS